MKWWKYSYYLFMSVNQAIVTNLNIANTSFNTIHKNFLIYSKYNLLTKLFFSFMRSWYFMLSWQEHEKRFISPGQGIPVNFFSFPWVDKIKKIFISKNFNHVTKIYLPSQTPLARLRTSLASSIDMVGDFSTTSPILQTKIYLPSNTLGWIKDFMSLIYRHGRGLLHHPTHLTDQDIPTLQHPWLD